MNDGIGPIHQDLLRSAGRDGADPDGGEMFPGGVKNTAGLGVGHRAQRGHPKGGPKEGQHL